MTNCTDKCWCKKLSAKEPDADAPPLLHDLFAMAHKIDHLYDGVEKLFQRIEDLEDRVTGISVCVCKLEESDYDERITDLENSNLEVRLIKIEKILQCRGSHGDKKPFVCPRCKDLTDCDMCASTGLVWG
jgi:hypothetical protein